MAIQFPRNTNATDVSLFLQRPATLGNPNAWTGLATNVAGLWSSPTLVTETTTGNPVTVTVSDRLTNNPAASYRLRACLKIQVRPLEWERGWWAEESSYNREERS